MVEFLIQTRALKKSYEMGETRVQALDGVDLDIAPGEFLAVMGASGSGKSTLMNILGCLDYPTSGEYRLDGVSIKDLSPNQLADVRAAKLGFVFQSFNLLPRTSAVENVELPLLYNRTGSGRDARERAVAALGRVGLGNRADHEPNQLSGGQQQRVAIARALVNHPSLLLADEPTGNLDSHTSLDVMALFQDLNDSGITIVLVTHEADIAACARRVVFMRDGRITSDEPVTGRRRVRSEMETALAAAQGSAP